MQHRIGHAAQGARGLRRIGQDRLATDIPRRRHQGAPHLAQQEVVQRAVRQQNTNLVEAGRDPPGQRGAGTAPGQDDGSGGGKQPACLARGELDVAQHVLRCWESKFPQVRPLKRGGGRRYYRPEDIELLRQIRSLLYDEGYTIKGAQKLLKGHKRPGADDHDADEVGDRAEDRGVSEERDLEDHRGEHDRPAVGRPADPAGLEQRRCQLADLLGGEVEDPGDAVLVLVGDLLPVRWPECE